jgi:adenylate cyclase
MTEERAKRKLRAILSADAVGYSRLMQEDEASTIRAVEDSKRLMSELIGQFKGRVVNAPGDNLLAEFASVVDATDCAVKIQRELKTKSAELPDNRQLKFRIGVNLGDVVKEADRIYGDGVNIAARIEGLAEPGGISISRNVCEHVKNKIALGYEYLGEHIVKNISEPVSRVQELFVNASGSSATYESKQVKIRQVSEELGVRYVLAGSLQRSNDSLRCNIQLVDAIAGNQIWADRFDRPIGDLFALQDDLVRQILVELQVKLTAGEFARIASRNTQNLDAWILFGQGFHEGFKYTCESMVRARELFESAHKKDPDWARPLVGLSWVYWNEARYRWTDDPDEWMGKGFELAEKAVELEPEEPGGYQMLGMLNLSKGDYGTAIAFREKALKLAPNDFVVVWGLGYTLYKAGEAQRGVDFLKKAERMSPHPPFLLLWSISEAQLLAGQYENAIETSKRAVALKNDRVFSHIILTAANSALGRPEEAQNEADEVLRINPNFTISGWMKSRLLKQPTDIEKYAHLLLTAGLPEN